MAAGRLKELREEKGVDAVVVADQYNVRYLSAYTGDTGYLYVSGEKQVLLTDARYTTQAEEETEGYEIIEISAATPYEAAIGTLLQADGVKHIGFEDGVFTHSVYKKMSDANDKVEWVPLGDAINNLRTIKNSEEIRKTAEAQKIADAAFDHILTILKPGMTEQEVALELEYYMRKHGAERLSFDVIAASGRHSAMPHAIPSAKKLEKGDFLTMDFGCVYEGYCSDMTRTVVIGHADQGQKEIYEIVLEAQKKGVEMIREGITGGEADKAARDVIEAAGYGKYFGHSLGHGTGLFIHENPRLGAGSNEILKEDMIVTVEPGIYIPGRYGVRIEDMVVVTKDGCRNLAHSEKQLIEV